MGYFIMDKISTPKTKYLPDHPLDYALSAKINSKPDQFWSLSFGCQTSFHLGNTDCFTTFGVP